MIEKKPPEDIDVESSVNEFVESFGGELVSKLITQPPAFKNADYLFKEYNVVAELKCLEKNLLKHKEYSYKINQLISKWIDKGLMKGSDAVKWLFGSFILPEKCLKDLIKLAKPQIERALHKAGKQIKEIKEHFNIKDAFGLVLIANDGNYAFESKNLVWLISHVLLMPQFKNSSIDAFVYFTVNMPARVSENGLDLMTWVPLYKDEKSKLQPFVNILGEEWGKFMHRKIGVPDAPLFKYKDEEILQKMKFLPKDFYKK